MKFSTAEELKLPGKVTEKAWDEAIEPFIYMGREVRFASPMSVSARYSFDGEGIDFTAHCETTMLSECARCGREFTEPLVFDMAERFVKGGTVTEDGDEEYSFNGDMLDISRPLADAAVLNMPLVSICREDCKGLCPVCGADLNLTACGCMREDIEEKNPFAALKALLSDDKEV